MEHYFKRLERTVKSRWDSTALCNFEGEQFTFGQTATWVERFHVLFEAAGIGKREKVVLCARNSARWAISFLAVNTYETVVVPLLADFLPENIATFTAHSDATALFIDGDVWPEIKPESIPAVRMVVNVADFSLLYAADDKVRDAFRDWDANFEKKYPDGFRASDVAYPCDNDKEIAIINYTSGTTSVPKGVMLRYECLSATMDFSVHELPVKEGSKIVSMLPMGHIYGLVFEFIYPLFNGAMVCYFGKTPSPTLLLKAMKQIKPFLVVTVPLVMEKIYKASIAPVISKFPMNVLLRIPIIGKVIYRKIGKKLEAAFGGRVLYFIMGGAALNPEVEKVFRKIGIPYMVGYGMTEASPLLGWVKPSEYVPGSCGRAVSCAEVRIDSGNPSKVAGEIQAKGANICSGYYKNEEANAVAFTEDGFFRTGDLGIIDKNGNIFIRGRLKNMILSSSGQNIYPEEVEAVVNSQPYVVESVVVDRSSKLVALVYLDEAGIKRDALPGEAVAALPETICENSNRHLPPYSKISKVELVPTPFEKTLKMSIKRFLYK